MADPRRSARKRDHLRLALARPSGATLLDEVILVHQSLPEQSWDEVDLRTTLGGRPLAHPVVINAMTGGVADARAINRDLGALAARLGLAVAVGSQRAALEDEALLPTYASVRDENPDGVVIANLGAGATVAEARAAVAMIGADLLQLHLNAPQELQMAEGDRDFRGQLARIAEVVAEAGVPVIVKECGFGLSAETALRLYRAGVRILDVSGRGGTNFARIERRRRTDARRADPGLLEWGIPTAASLLDVARLPFRDLEVVASGGIRHGSEAAKALALGARAVGVAGEVWRHLHAEGRGGAQAFLEGFLADLKAAALLAGARSVADLWAAPRVYVGTLWAWLQQRPPLPAEAPHPAASS